VTVEVSAEAGARPDFELLERCDPARPIGPPGAESKEAGEEDD
jgi:hypothetical protein